MIFKLLTTEEKRAKCIAFAKEQIAKNGKVIQLDFKVKDGAPCSVETIKKLFDGWRKFLDELRSA